jgi:hypothetical protein
MNVVTAALVTPPIAIVIGCDPLGVPGAIVALIWYSPARFGVSPEKAMFGAIPDRVGSLACALLESLPTAGDIQATCASRFAGGRSSVPRKLHVCFDTVRQGVFEKDGVILNEQHISVRSRDILDCWGSLTQIRFEVQCIGRGCPTKGGKKHCPQFCCSHHQGLLADDSPRPSKAIISCPAARDTATKGC